MKIFLKIIWSIAILALIFLVAANMIMWPTAIQDYFGWKKDEMFGVSMIMMVIICPLCWIYCASTYKGIGKW